MVEMQIKGLQEPYYNSCNENHGKGSRYKVLRLVPDEHSNALRSRKPVIWQLHYKWNRLTLKLRRTQYQSEHNGNNYSRKIQQCHYQRPVFREKRRCKQTIYRQLGRAAHKWCKKNRHLTVSLRRESSGRHNSRNRTAEADNHRDEASSRQTQLSQQLIHYKSHSGHISAVLQH